jgi:hypothetical protein
LFAARFAADAGDRHYRGAVGAGVGLLAGRGKDNYPVDRAVGDQIAQVLPGIVTCAQAGRMFLSRAVRFMAGEAGIRQFLDIGAGLPTFEDNTHEVAQHAAPESRVVYVDNDQLVVVHARALQASSPDGEVDVVQADLRDPADVLAGAARTLDFRQPAAVLLLGVLWHVLDDGEAATIISGLMGPLAAGSYLAIEHPTLEVTGPKMAQAIAVWNTHGTPPGTHRTPQQLQQLLAGLDLVQPGIVPCTRRRPEASPFGQPAPVDAYCAVGRTPQPVARAGRP